MLICPVCSAPLAEAGRTLRCPAGHSFDLAASGYCNLLTGSRNGAFMGDDREMVAARRRFLESGAYAPLREALCRLLVSLTEGRSGLSLLDAGCGEGYYTRAAAAALSGAGRLSRAVGADISKAATRYAAGRDRSVRYVTANTYRLPIADGCADLILSLFAPAPADEFRRVLAPDGLVIRAVPGADHLWELKEAVYDEPYRNREEKHRLAGFDECDRLRVEYPFTLDSAERIRDLFAMTPYARRTPRQGLERLEKLDRLEVTFSFLLLVCRPAALDS
ncbi:MAG: methyltransferase domain-containing protein [Oscillospiraceae bacterium]|nr:methyltransferase domain-containing protein [Oscillospiraceae bacterium]